MTRKPDIAKGREWKEIWKRGPDGTSQPDWLRSRYRRWSSRCWRRRWMTLRAQKGERTPEGLGYRSGYYTQTVVTRVGKLTLRVPQDRNGRCRTEVFKRYQRSEKPLVVALAEVYLQGVSTRKVNEVTEQLCGHEFSASTGSRMTEKLDRELEKFAGRRPDEEYPYVILDAPTNGPRPRDHPPAGCGRGCGMRRLPVQRARETA